MESSVFRLESSLIQFKSSLIQLKISLINWRALINWVDVNLARHRYQQLILNAWYHLFELVISYIQTSDIIYLFSYEISLIQTDRQTNKSIGFGLPFVQFVFRLRLTNYVFPFCSEFWYWQVPRSCRRWRRCRWWVIYKHGWLDYYTYLYDVTGEKMKGHVWGKIS